MKISVASFSFHGLLAEGQIDIFGYLESVKYRFRLGAADIWNGLLTSLEEAYLRKVRRAMDERGLVLANYHADGVHVWEPEPDARERNYRGALAHLHAAAILGAQTVRIDTGGTLRVPTEEEFETLAARYREYAHFGADRGFRVGPENHWGFSLFGDTMERLARAVDHPGYGILLHIGHWEDGDEEGGDRRMAPWTAHTHVDARVTSTCLEPKMRLLAGAGYDGYWGVEHHSGRNEYYEVAYQIAEVERVLTGWKADPGAYAHMEAGKDHNPLLNG